MSSRAGGSGRQPYPSKEILADPRGAPHHSRLDKALRTPNKSAELLSALLKGASGGGGAYLFRVLPILNTLPDEPNLTTGNLSSLAELALAHGWWYALEAICAHPRASDALPDRALCFAPAECAINVAAATGWLFPAVISGCATSLTWRTGTRPAAPCVPAGAEQLAKSGSRRSTYCGAPWARPHPGWPGSSPPAATASTTWNNACRRAGWVRHLSLVYGANWQAGDSWSEQETGHVVTSSRGGNSPTGPD